MGQQSNKIIKRRRRAAYLERQKVKAADLAASAKAKPRRPVAAKKSAPAPAEAAPTA
jgi:hypothetical protein